MSTLDKKPSQLKSVSYAKDAVLNLPKYVKKPAKNKELVGIDIFVHWNGTDPNELAAIMQSINLENKQLTMITNRGIKVWPDGFNETYCT
ncbi:NADP-dependent isocitrate dehydrogenase, partial [Flavobacterium sp. XS1P32]